MAGYTRVGISVALQIDRFGYGRKHTFAPARTNGAAASEQLATRFTQFFEAIGDDILQTSSSNAEV